MSGEPINASLFAGGESANVSMFGADGEVLLALIDLEDGSRDDELGMPWSQNVEKNLGDAALEGTDHIDNRNE